VPTSAALLKEIFPFQGHHLEPKSKLQPPLRLWATRTPTEAIALGAALRTGLTAALTSGIGYAQLTSRLRKRNVAYTTPGIANRIAVRRTMGRHSLPLRHTALGKPDGSSSIAAASSSHRVVASARRGRQVHRAIRDGPRESAD
jgi:hypothetical protein